MSDPSPPSLPRRRVVSVAAVIVLLQLVTLPVLVSLDESGADAESATPDEVTETEPGPRIAPQDFSGSGRERTEVFEIEGGLVVFLIEHDAGGNFIVRLEDPDGNRVAGLANVIGDFDGSTATHVEGGEYELAVRALGDWSVAVQQPRYRGGNGLPVSYAGDQPTAAGPFEVDEDDTVEFAATHAGDGNFIVRLLDRDGRRTASVMNAQGTVDTAEELDVDAGVYLLDVKANGAWTIEIR